MGQVRTVKRRTSNAITTTTTWKKNSPGKRTTTRSYVAGGNRISYNLNTGKTKKTKLWQNSMKANLYFLVRVIANEIIDGPFVTEEQAFLELEKYPRWNHLDIEVKQMEITLL